MSGADAREPERIRAAKDARLTWVLGGSALLASVVLPIIINTQVMSGTGYVGTGLHVFALVIFAIGIRGSGSVTGRRPLGTVALLALAGWTVAYTVFASLGGGAFIDSSGVPAAWWSAVVTVDLFLRLALALIVVVQIARHDDVPRPWNLAPLWAFAAMVVTAAAVQVAVVATPAGGGVGLALLLFGVQTTVQVASYVFLGVLAIVLAARPPRTETVTVFSGSSSTD
jgi:hypothetical protein